MKKLKTIIDEVFDYLLILVPLILLVDIDILSRGLIVTYFVYLPYIFYKFLTHKKTVVTQKTRKNVGKKVEVEEEITCIV